MAEGSISTSDLPLNVLGGVFYFLDDDYIRNYDNVGELSNKNDCDSESIFDR